MKSGKKKKNREVNHNWNAPRCGKTSPNLNLCNNCGYSIRKHYSEPYLEYLYRMMKEALDRQDYHREKAKQDGELKMWGRVKTIRMWGETAMGYQSRIEVSRTDPDGFTREAEAWSRRK